MTTPRTSKPPLPDSADGIVAEIEASQRWALRPHSCKPLCPSIANLILVKIEVSQRWALRQHFCKPLCPGCSNVKLPAPQPQAAPRRRNLCPHSRTVTPGPTRRLSRRLLKLDAPCLSYITLLKLDAPCFVITDKVRTKRGMRWCRCHEAQKGLRRA